MGSEKKVEVSVICMTYNHEKYISDALESFVTQITDFDYEVIVHDDASTDKTADIIREYEQKYPHIVRGLYDTENQFSKGKHMHIDIAYPVAKGKYVAICEGDDYWIDSNKLQKQYNYMQNHPECSLCLHAYREILNDAEHILGEHHALDQDGQLPIDMFIKWSRKTPQIASAFFRKSMAENRPELFWQIKSGDSSYISDRPLYLYLSLNGNVHYMNDVMSVYRRCIGSWTHSMRYDTAKVINFCKNKIIFWEKFDEYTKYKYSSIVEQDKSSCKYQMSIHEGNFRSALKEYGMMGKKIKLTTLAVLTLGCLFPKAAIYLFQKRMRRGYNH